MTYAAQRTTIMTQWDTQWKAIRPLVPYAHGNARFDPPVDNPWLRISILDGESQQASFGATDRGLHRHVGVVSIDAYVPLGTGEALLRTLLDEATDIFRSRVISGIVFRAPRLSSGQPSDNYFRMTATIPFQRDEVFS
jgi:hypothetical protein